MGYWDPPEPKYPECPVCGCEAEEFYLDFNGNICGCDVCISTRDAVEYMEEKDEAAMEAETERQIDMLLENRYEN